MPIDILLTVAVPTRNRAAFLAECLASVLAQVDDGVEVLVSDNASTDSTEGVVQELLSGNPELRYVRNTTDLGPDGNFLRCVEEARGRFVHILCDDDVMLPGCVKTLTDALAANSDACFAYLNARGFKGAYDVERLGRCWFNDRVLQVYSDKGGFAQKVKFHLTFASCMVFRREYVIKSPLTAVGNSTNLLQSYLAFICLAGQGPALLVANSFIANRMDNFSGRINYYRVFAANWKTVLLQFGPTLGMSEKAMKAVFRSTVREYLGPATAASRVSQDAECAFSDRRLLFAVTWPYPESWLLVYPFVVAPPVLLAKLVPVVRVLMEKL